jgi:hypothetical protein
MVKAETKPIKQERMIKKEVNVKEEKIKIETKPIKREQRNIKEEIKEESMIKTEITVVKLEKKGKKIKDEGGSPFSEFKRPTHDDCMQTVESLIRLHGR